MIYDYPQYYEVAFSFRDIPAEAAFLRSCIDRFGITRLDRVLEIGCGPAPHAGELVKYGYQYVGLDINRNMLDYATYKWKNLAPRPKFVQADMVSFDLAHQVQFAYIMLGSLYTRSNEELQSHFDSMSRALEPGGLYFLDWCIQFGDLRKLKDNSFKYSQDEIDVESHFNIKLLDQEEQTYEEVWTLTVNDQGRQRKFTMTERNRALLPSEFLNIIESREDFELVVWWRDWDFTKPIKDSRSVERPVALVRRVANSPQN